LAASSRPYQVLLAGQVGFLLLAGYGAILEFQTRLHAGVRAVEPAVSAGPVIATASAVTREIA
jgi:hypothetical protein